ncbi:MAG: hypothetical protein U9Q33_09455 [Campylobacterota bacterium]|nr:hypothetical protein [Campylobacterota bacterium]
MHTLKLNVQDNIYNHIMFLLNNINSKVLEIVEDKVCEDWSHLESEIDKGIASGISDQSHEKIIASIKQKYA